MRELVGTASPPAPRTDVLAGPEQALKMANKYCAKSGQQGVVENYGDKTLDNARAGIEQY